MMDRMVSPRFGATQAYNPEYPCFSVGSANVGPQGSVKIMGSGPILDNNLELAAVEREMASFRGKDPGKALAAQWLEKARIALIKTFSKPELALDAQEREQYLAALTQPIVGFSDQMPSGAQSLFFNKSLGDRTDGHLVRFSPDAPAS